MRARCLAYRAVNKGILAVQTESGLQRPERWSDTPSLSDVPEPCDRIVLPVEMTYYHRKGGTGVRLTWGDHSRGVGFDRKKLSPYDLLFQVLRNTVQARTLSPSLAREEPFEPPACLWWQDANLNSSPAF
jgi:hypothetical protein